MKSVFSAVILIPSYNTGPALLERTVREVLELELPVWVVIDGSTDGSAETVQKLAAAESAFRVIVRETNGGKGAAVLTGVEAALADGFTHALIMDADGQHSAAVIPKLLETARRNPQALVLGDPQYGPDAPAIRMFGRKVHNWWTDLETCWNGIGDTLFGMRVYPLEPLARVFAETRHARGFDFDPEAAVRLFWMGLPPVQVPVPCRYLPKEEGGVSHFNYLRDNLLLIGLHFRLVPEWLLFRLPRRLREKWTSAGNATEPKQKSAS